MTEEFTDLTFCDCLIFAFIHLFIYSFTHSLSTHSVLETLPPRTGGQHGDLLASPGGCGSQRRAGLRLPRGGTVTGQGEKGRVSQVSQARDTAQRRPRRG